MAEKFLERESAEEGDGFEKQNVGNVSEDRGDKSAQVKSLVGVGGTRRALDAVNALKKVVIEQLTGQETNDAGDKNAASIIGDNLESEVVGSGIIGQKTDDEHYQKGEESDTRAAPADKVGGAPAVDFDQNIAQSVGKREENQPAVDGKVKEVPELDGGVVGDDDGHSHEGGNDNERRLSGGSGATPELASEFGFV